MKTAIAVLLSPLIFGLLFSGPCAHAEGPSPKKVVTSSTLVHNSDADTMRLQGEQRYRANCARCHAAPQKFPPRMMATVLRHMRVRATITDEDMRLVLFYMSQ
jgi:hypothetical protein